MAITVRPTRRKAPGVGVKFVTRRRGAKILDGPARTDLGMSGDEFVRRYRAGEIEDPDRSDVVQVAMLIQLAER